MRRDLISRQLAIAFRRLRRDRPPRFPLSDARGDVLADGGGRAGDIGALADIGDQLGKLLLGVTPRAADAVIFGAPLAGIIAANIEFQFPILLAACADVASHFSASFPTTTVCSPTISSILAIR
jgi:hypothetical protein